MRWHGLGAVVCVIFCGVLGCSGDDEALWPAADVDMGSGDQAPPPAADVDVGSGDQAPPQDVTASCVSSTPFSASGSECREYLGGWLEARARNNCIGLEEASFAMGAPCATQARLGHCLYGLGTDEVYRTVIEGEGTEGCSGAQMGCEIFGRGTFAPEPVCVDSVAPPYEPELGSVYVRASLECKAPVDGKPASRADGQVCARQWIGGCTEEGRKFEDYASCAAVRSQRGYYAAPPAMDFRTAPDDPILDDPAFRQELDWVTTQAEACGCVCCHKASSTPMGASQWYIDSGGVWTDTIVPAGLAMLGGLENSDLLGAYDPADNFGFSRSTTGLPTNDPERMRAFFVNEFRRRGLDPEDYRKDEIGPAFLVGQYTYVPQACDNGEGIARDGTITWTGGDARYVYVLEEGADNPAAPPNLDKPQGTLWLLEIPWDQPPIRSESLRYGVVSAPQVQSVPDPGDAPPELVPGRRYYLYVLADIVQPRTRCLFTY